MTPRAFSTIILKYCANSLAAYGSSFHYAHIQYSQKSSINSKHHVIIFIIKQTRTYEATCTTWFNLRTPKRNKIEVGFFCTIYQNLNLQHSVLAFIENEFSPFAYGECGLGSWQELGRLKNAKHVSSLLKKKTCTYFLGHKNTITSKESLVKSFFTTHHGLLW